MKLEVERGKCPFCGLLFTRLLLAGKVYSEGETTGDLCGSKTCEKAYWNNAGGYLERDASEALEVLKWDSDLGAGGGSEL
jgi:hypothetical protein